MYLTPTLKLLQRRQSDQRRHISQILRKLLIVGIQKENNNYILYI